MRNKARNRAALVLAALLLPAAVSMGSSCGKPPPPDAGGGGNEAGPPVDASRDVRGEDAGPEAAPDAAPDAVSDAPPPPPAADSVFIVRSSIGRGSGFLVAHEGAIFGATAFHVVAMDTEVTVEKEMRGAGASYTMPAYATVIYVDAQKDIAILRFPSGMDVQKVLGPPMRLATLEELQGVSGQVNVLGSDRNIGGAGGFSRIFAFSPSPSLKTGLRLVSPVSPFTGQAQHENNPQGFLISPAIHRGFSGGPAVQGGGAAPVVVGMALTLAREAGTDQSESVIVASTEIADAINRASRVPAAGLIKTPAQIRDQCQASFQRVIEGLRSVRVVSPDQIVQALTSGQALVEGGEKLATVYPRLSPFSRRWLFQSDELARQMTLELATTQASALGSLVTFVGAVHLALDFQPYCSTEWNGLGTRCIARHCSGERLCIGTNLLTDLTNVAGPLTEFMAQARTTIEARIADVAQYFYALQMMVGLTQEMFSPDSSYQAQLGEEGTTVTDEREGEQVIFYRYDIKDSSGKYAETVSDIDFEFAQGDCTLAMDRLSARESLGGGATTPGGGGMTVAVTLTNQTQSEIYYFYAWPCGTTGPGEDRLGASTVEPGQSFSLQLEPGCWNASAEGMTHNSLGTWPNAQIGPGASLVLR